MKMKESPTLEFKRELTDAIKREIIAFANTQGGERYIGVDGTNYETMRSLHQELTFMEAEAIFKEQNLKFGLEQMRTLGLVTEDGYYTNLGLLFSDQCEHSIKCARYLGNDKLEFQDRKEFSGSILTQVEAAYEYLSLNNAKYAHFEGLKRIEIESYPSYALREALINAVTHRDYSFSGSILIHLFQDRLELVSVGGLVKGLTLEDIELGISQSRNPKLANILYRLKWIESYGTGLQRIKESYKNSAVEPHWMVGPNAFVVKLPKNTIPMPSEEDEVLTAWLAQNQDFSAKDLEMYLHKSKGTVRKILEELLQSGQIIRVGSGPSTRYQVVAAFK